MQEATGVAGLSGFTSRFADNSDGWQPGGLTGQKVNPVQIIIKEMGSGGASDALNQRGSIGKQQPADIKTDKLLETRESQLHYSVTQKGKRDSLKSNWIRQSAAKQLTVAIAA